MTGFGRAEVSKNGATVTVEVYSLNGRFLDVRTKLPKALYPYESHLRKLTQEYIGRGKVNVTVNVARESARADSMDIDYRLVDKYMALSLEIANRYGIEHAMDTKTVMSLPEVVVWNENGDSNGDLWLMTEQVARSAFDAHRSMRADEGSRIGADICQRLETVADLVDAIEKRAPELAVANRERLKKRLEQLIGKDDIDEIRFAMEVALYAERIDVTEECVRFKSHIGQFSREIAARESSGKKLLFLLQEMNREANTIGSKIMDADCTQMVVRIKEELEKIREQAENSE
jgi:uncharacterized protein (TIGR00255 family)